MDKYGFIYYQHLKYHMEEQILIQFGDYYIKWSLHYQKKQILMQELIKRQIYLDLNKQNLREKLKKNQRMKWKEKENQKKKKGRKKHKKNRSKKMLIEINGMYGI